MASGTIHLKKLVKVAALFATLATLLSYGATQSASERDSLRQIVQAQCLQSFRLRGSPAPCKRLVLPTARDQSSGYAILKDRKPGAHFLLIPVRSISGIESPELYEQSAPNFIANAWQSRDVLNEWVGRRLPPEMIGLAINPRLARGQDQFHIHIECIGPLLAETLDHHAEEVGPQWSPLWIGRRRFLAKRFSEAELERRNPLQSLGAELPDPSLDRGAYTLVVAGRRLASGESALIIVAGTGKPGGESLLDSACIDPAPEPQTLTTKLSDLLH